MNLVLTYLNGPSQGQTLELKDYPAGIGKTEARCPVYINDRDCADEEAVIIRKGDRFVLQAGRQTCRVRLNGRRLETGKDRFLFTGDVIESGRTLLLAGIGARAAAFASEKEPV